MRFSKRPPTHRNIVLSRCVIYIRVRQKCPKCIELIIPGWILFQWPHTMSKHFLESISDHQKWCCTFFSPTSMELKLGPAGRLVPGWKCHLKTVSWTKSHIRTIFALSSDLFRVAGFQTWLLGKHMGQILQDGGKWLFYVKFLKKVKPLCDLT